MKQRVTYIVTKPHDFRPEQIRVSESKDEFHVNGLEAAKEHRITLGLDELPSEISVALQQWHEVHVRWVSSSHYTSSPPFISRVSPGLHVFFTPLDSTDENALCKQLHALVSPQLKCSTTDAASIKLPILSERFSMSSASEYYAYLPSISETVRKLGLRLCKDKVKDSTCQKLMSGLIHATYLDVDYDTITRALVLTAGWPSKLYSDGSRGDSIIQREEDGTVEIGVLMHEPNTDPEDVQFGGFLTVLGQDATPKATRFQAPARHYPLLSKTKADSSQPPVLHPLTFTTSFQQPTGLHPTLVISFPEKHLTAPDQTCKLHAHLTLPSYLFIDKYQFSDALFLQSKNLKSLRSLAGATDLEAPDWVIDAWGSAALFELAHPDEQSASTGQSWNVSIPMHLRYLPASNISHTRVPVPWPVVFWACRAEEGAKMAANPFDRVHLGYEALFGPKTRFMHVQPAAAEELVEYIDVPVLDLRKTGWVEMGTVVTIVAAFVGLCWVLFGKVGAKEPSKKVKGGNKE